MIIIIIPYILAFYSLTKLYKFMYNKWPDDGVFKLKLVARLDK